MQDLQLLDLANRKGKAPGRVSMHARGVAAAVHLHERRWPAARCGNPACTKRATPSTRSPRRHEELFAYRTAPIEFCEVASMSMELLGNEFIESFYNPADAKRARRMHLERIIGFFPWIATVDAFQHWIYSHPGHTRAERRAAWLALMDRFGGDVDWSGYEAARAALWHRAVAHLSPPFLLRGIRHRPTRRAATLGELEVGPG